MARRKLYWHIGPADPGTAFLAEALAARSDELSEREVQAFTARDAHDAEHDLRQSGWARIERKIWEHKGVSLLSTPEAAPLGRDRIRLALDGLRGVEVHLVLLVRDLPSQVHAGWQEVLTQGRTTSAEKYAERVLDPSRSHAQAETFWSGRDLTGILDRWTSAMHAERVHVLGVPGDADAIWGMLLGIAGVDNVPRPEQIGSKVLGATAAEVLRLTNRADDDNAGAAPVGLAMAGFASGPDSAASMPLDDGCVHRLVVGWEKRITEGGFDMQGSLTGPTTTEAVATTTADHLEVATETLAAAGAEIARLRTELIEVKAENERLDRKRRKHKRRVKSLEAQQAGRTTGDDAA